MTEEIKTTMKIIKDTKNFVKLVENKSTDKVFPDFKNFKSGSMIEQSVYFDRGLYERGVRRIIIDIE